MKKFFVAKPNTWFNEGSVVELITDCSSDDFKQGVFRGIRTCQNKAAENKPIGCEYLDEEMCLFEEFQECILIENGEVGNG